MLPVAFSAVVGHQPTRADRTIPVGEQRLQAESAAGRKNDVCKERDCRLTDLTYYYVVDEEVDGPKVSSNCVSKEGLISQIYSLT